MDGGERTGSVQAALRLPDVSHGTYPLSPTSPINKQINVTKTRQMTQARVKFHGELLKNNNNCSFWGSTFRGFIIHTRGSPHVLCPLICDSFPCHSVNSPRKQQLLNSSIHLPWHLLPTLMMSASGEKHQDFLEKQLWYHDTKENL